MKYISDCDVIIYDMHSGNPRDIDLALNALKKYNFESEKILILISSIMLWNHTDQKMEEVNDKAEKEEGEEEGAENPDEAKPEEEEPEDRPDSQAEGDEAAEGDEEGKEKVVEEEPVKQYRVVPFGENDFAERRSSPEYDEIRRIEDEVLSFKKENLKTYVISAGILYGNGETVFNEHFKSAWLQKPKRLPYVCEGDNQVPTIHVIDLARLVMKVYQSKPEQ
jgi:adenylate kinase